MLYNNNIKINSLGNNHEYPIWHAVTPSYAQPWPMPNSIAQTKTLFEIDCEHFDFVLSNITNSVLIDNIDRYKRIICEDQKLSPYPWDHQARQLEELVAMQSRIDKFTENKKQLGDKDNTENKENAGGNYNPIRMVELLVFTHGEKYPHLRMDESCMFPNFQEQHYSKRRSRMKSKIRILDPTKILVSSQK